ncbi:MAG: hypothetical protein CM15mP64_4930 [Candidatus Neomarinimicrobiota bacterium]|nr:MAG: hypothetical protein CM15mP64_4930 [Candidatus Neomarinimicrobiota bacterium]
MHLYIFALTRKISLEKKAYLDALLGKTKIEGKTTS